MPFEIRRKRGGSKKHTDIIPLITDLELGWVAGIIEGEGSFAFGTSLRIVVSQKDRWLLERLVNFYGGRIYPQRKGKYTSSWNWILTGPRARGLGRLIKPYLSPRRQLQLQKVWTENI